MSCLSCKYNLLSIAALMTAALTSCARIFPPNEDGVPAVKYHRHEELRHHEVTLSAGFLNLALTEDLEKQQQIYDDLQLTNDDWIWPRPTLSFMYYYHFNDRVAVGFEAGGYWWKRHYDNDWYSENKYWAEWNRYTDFRDAWKYRHPGQVFPWSDWQPAEEPYDEVRVAMYKTFFMPSVKYTWARYPSTTLYNRFSLGVLYDYTRVAGKAYPSFREWRICPYLTLFGLDFGKGALHGFFEIGVGVQGFLSAGISYRF